jgi:hypothetical protein
MATMAMATAAMESAPVEDAAGAAIAMMAAPTGTDEGARTGNAMDVAESAAPTQVVTMQAEAMQMAAPTATAMPTQPPTATSTDAIDVAPTVTVSPLSTPTPDLEAAPTEGFGGAALYLLGGLLFIFALVTTLLRGRLR